MVALRILKEFCVEIGHDDEEFLEELVHEGFISLTISELDLVLVAEDEGQRISIKAEVGQVNFSQSNSLDILKVLLEANFEFSGTRGGIIGVNSNTGDVCLFYQFYCQDISQSALQQLVYEFAEVGRLWNETLNSFSQGAV